MFDFHGKTAMVTGAGKNIGKAVAMQFAQAGANIVLCDYNAEAAAQTAQEIRALGVGVMEAVADVRDRKAIFALVEKAVAQFGKIDILVNNAGGSADLLGKLTRFADAEEETLDFVLDINIKGTMNCTQAVLKASMLDNKYGKIVNVASIAGVGGLVNRVDYSCAKGGIISMTKALAMEVGEYNICVNAVSPGAISRDGWTMDGMTFLGENGRVGTPQEMANVILFLASTESDFVTGANYIVDGGRSLGPKSMKW